ncbi:MAG TPA: isoprenylcysteine carboxylmethyltransferase family protein [Rhizomicrobium sp.]|nr:isoprenylcysteine carboxylmethyltransferase family protein [Rhizomicrobium sp.]
MTDTKPTVQPFLRSFIWFALMAAALFLGAGDWSWPEGWAFIAIFVAASIVFGLWLARRDPALLALRLQVVQEGQSAWDRLFLTVFILVWFAWLVWMGLDAERWRLSHVPLALKALGGALMVAGFLATARVLRENSFATPVVRIQEERGHRVIDTGPYAIVRHPMYASAALYLVGIPLLLGSWWGLLAVPAFMTGVSIRAAFEERLLARELPGYADYMTRVRWRLVPGVW